MIKLRLVKLQFLLSQPIVIEETITVMISLPSPFIT